MMRFGRINALLQGCLMALLGAFAPGVMQPTRISL